MQAENAKAIDWLLARAEPWVVYNTLTDLAGSNPGGAEAKAAYQAMQAHPQVEALIESLATWPPERPLKRAYDPKDSQWKLQTLADFGLDRADERIAAIAERVFAAQAEDGAFLHGGFDHTHSWDTRPYVCVAHVMTYALARFGYLNDPRLERAFEQLLAWQRLDGGWHPNRQNLPGNRGETEASCPFGTSNVLRAIGAHPALRDGQAAKRAVDYLLTCWERRAEPFRPVGFGMGSEWSKAQYPFVQYQLLKTVDTLTMIPVARADSRLLEMVDRLKDKRGPDGNWTAEGASKSWSDFDFGQKKQASPWITFLALRVLARCGKL